jgi:hypothetical protein
MADLSKLAWRFLELLVERDGRAGPGELGAAAEPGGVTPNRQARTLRELHSAGLVTRTKREVLLTPAGWALATSPVHVGVGERLAAALGIWPHEHRSFLELLLSAIVCRHHLGDARTKPHLGFMAIGASGSGKSPMAEFVCWLFGWPPEEHTVYLKRETKGSVLGRREQSADGIQFVPSPFFDLPFVCFDEFDKGNEETRAAVLPYFQENTRVLIEKGIRTSRPTPMLAANPPRHRSEDRYWMLPDEYRRRSVVVDTGDTAHDELEAPLRAFHETERLPLLNLNELVPPAELSSSATRALELVRDVLSKDGKSFFPKLRALEHLALGRAALLGPDTDPLLAAYATGFSYLSCASTIPGLVDDGWQLPLEAIRKAIGPDTDIAVLEQAVAREAEARAERAKLRTASRRAKTSLDLEQISRRGELLERIAQALKDLDGRSVPRGHGVEAGGIRTQLKRLQKLAEHVETADSIEDLEHAALEPLRRAQHLHEVIVQEKKDEQREADHRKDQERQAKQSRALMPRGPTPAQVRKAQKAQLNALLNEILGPARELERYWKRKTTKSDEHPLQDLASLRVLGERILKYKASPRTHPSRGLSIAEEALRILRPGGIARQQPGYWFSDWDDRVRFPGSPRSSPHLAEWGASSRWVLAPVLAVLHAREDELRAQLDLLPRQGRPDVDWQPSPSQHAAKVVQLPVASRGGLS